MTNEFITPDQGTGMPENDNRRKMLIIGGVVLLLLCCCCTLAVAGWYGGDYLVEFLGM